VAATGLRQIVAGTLAWLHPAQKLLTCVPCVSVALSFSHMGTVEIFDVGAAPRADVDRCGQTRTQAEASSGPSVQPANGLSDCASCQSDGGASPPQDPEQTEARQAVQGLMQAGSLFLLFL
jgi:hypothetical protein